MGARFLHGDCFDLLPDMEARSIDLILADMPYGTTAADWDKPLDLERLWPELRRIARGPIILFAQAPYDKVLACSNLQEFRYEWIWEKTHATGHLNAKIAPLKAHEAILVFGRTPVYNPIKTQGHPRKTATKRGDKTPIYGAQTSSPIRYDSTERYPRTVLTYSSDKQRTKLHPTQKPVALLDYMIRTYTNEGGTVLDFCMGSGSTGVAALQAGRAFVGIERKAEFFAIASDRCQPSESIEPAYQKPEPEYQTQKET